MVLFLHNRYRTTGGEERVVEDLLALVPRAARRAGRAARARLGGARRRARRPRPAARRAAGARGRRGGAADRRPHRPRAQPAAERSAGARWPRRATPGRASCCTCTSTGSCARSGSASPTARDCTRCHGRNTLPGVVHNCRGARAEAGAYAASLALLAAAHGRARRPRRRSERIRRARLRALGAPLPEGRVRVLRAARRIRAGGGCRRARRPAAVRARRLPPLAGEGRRCGDRGVPARGDAARRRRRRSRARAAARARGGPDVRFEGRVEAARLAELRAGAAIALVPSRSAETFGIAAAEAMAAGLPVLASRIGALPELLDDDDALVAAGDARALAEAIGRLAGDRERGERGRRRVSEICSPQKVAAGLAAHLCAGRGGRSRLSWPHAGEH